MGHSVHFRDAAGEAKLEDDGSLEVALERVERLRNDDGATEIRVFREVPIEVHTYYRVVAVDESTSQDTVTEVTEAEVAEAEVAEAEVAEVASVAEVAPVAVLEPPSGAMVMSPSPVSAVPDASHDELAAAEAHAGEGRRQLFSRS